MQNMIKIMVADEHSLYRETFTTFLKHHQFDVIASSGSNDELIQIFKSHGPPDIAILNYKTTMPSNIEAAAWIKKNFDNVKVVINTLFDQNLPRYQFESIGIDAILIKSSMDGQQIVDVLCRIHKNNELRKCCA